MTIKVQYHNNVYDIISADILQRLIESGKIKMFYRYSEKRWVAVGADPLRIRAQTVAPYCGPERRAPKVHKTPSLTTNHVFQVKGLGL